MNIFEMVLDALLNLLSIYIDFRFLDFFLVKKKNKKVNNVIYIVTWLLNLWVYFYFDNVYLTSCSLLILLLLAAVLIYEGRIIRKIVAVFSCLAIGVVVDDIVWRFCVYFNILDKIELFASLIVSLILITIILLLECFIKPDKTKYITRDSYINILLILAGNVVLIYILTDIVTVERFDVMAALIFISLIDISTFWLYDKVNEVYGEKIEKQMMQERIEMYERTFQIIQQKDKKIKSLEHDMKTHLLLLNSYIKDGNYTEASNYINKMADFTNVPNEYVETGNLELDSILNYSLDKAEKLQCKTEIDITVPDSSFMPGIDMNIILGNLLDNALEALELIDEKYLYIGISYKKGVLIIRIRNSFDGIIEKKGESLQSRKKEKQKHGIGMENIKEIVDKYDGKIDIDYTNDMFKVDIVLYV